MNQTSQLPRTLQILNNRQSLRMVAYGDSISEVGRTRSYFGGASSPDMNWQFRLAAMMRQKFPASDITITPFAIGGQNTYEGLGRLDYIPLPADLVFLEFGANDCVHHPLEPAETARALRELIQGLRARHQADVVVMGMAGDNPCDPVQYHIPQTVQLQRQAALELNAPFADLRQAILQATDQGRSWTKYHNGSRDCHPNDAGHQAWADCVWNIIQSHLGSC